jgi:Membrane dipeptidase (Peptidase family M19)
VDHSPSFLFGCLLALLVNTAGAQPHYNSSYVDFHIHTILKNYYRNIPTPEDASAVSFGDTSNWVRFRGDKKDTLGFNNVKSVDQATYSLLGPAHASILCTSLYTLEKQSLTSKCLPVSGIIRKNWLRKTLEYSILFPFDHILSIRFINKLWVTGISQERQHTAYRSDVSNFQELLGQLNYVRRQAQTFHSSKPIVLAGPGSDLNDTSRIWLVLTVEGGHNFYGAQLSDPGLIRGHRITETQEREILENLDAIKNAYRLFFVTPSHLFENKISGGARGLDIENGLFRNVLSRLMWDRRFSIIDNKDIEGVNHIHYVNTTKTSLRDPCDCHHDPHVLPDTVTMGWDFIRKVLDTNRYGKRTYLDLRHMDVLARMQIIDSITSWNNGIFKNNKVPLIISHAAVSGKDRRMASFLGLCPIYDNYEEFIQQDIREFYTMETGLCPGNMGLTADSAVDNFLANKGGWFHPMSNNLFDEEIQAVYQTGGIIGITMEERALGWKAYNYEENPVTRGRLGCYLDSLYSARGEKLDGKLRDSLLKTEPFIRNLFYIVEMSGCKGTEAWDHIAIGSDFDGIMNPIDICPKASDIPNFYRFLCDHLTDFAAYLGKGCFLYDQTPEQAMDKLFFKNGESFIRKYF